MTDINELVLSHQGLVYGIARRCSCIHDPDLIQEGNIGLIKAAQSYDPNKGKFSTYAYMWIKGHMLMEFKRRKKHRCVSLDMTLAEDTGAALGDMIPDKTCVEEDVLSQSYVESVFAELSKPNQMILSLVLAGKTQPQIAETLNVKPTQIAQRIGSTKDRLRGVSL